MSKSVPLIYDDIRELGWEQLLFII